VFDHKALLKHFQESGKTVIYALPQKTIYKLLETTCFKNQFCVSELVHLALISFNKNFRVKQRIDVMELIRCTKSIPELHFTTRKQGKRLSQRSKFKCIQIPDGIDNSFSIDMDSPEI
jgi:hypothetical protein